MFSILGDVLTAIEDFPLFILTGAEDLLNALFAAIGALITGLFSLLPSMPSLPTIPAGQWLSWANWVYPFGTMFSILTGCVTMYVAYLAVRYVLSLVRAAE